MTKQLDNVSYAEFLRFDEEKFNYYKRMGLLMKPDSGDLDEITNWNYGKVKELQMKFTVDILFKEIPNILSFTHDAQPDDFRGMKWHKVFGLYNHIVSEMEMIKEKEKVLAYEPSANETEAGIERITKFGVFATINTLAQGNVLLYDSIEATPYNVIFLKLYLESEISQYVKNLTAINTRQMKR